MIKITPSAHEYFKTIILQKLKTDNQSVGFRLSLADSGCSGYKLAWETIDIEVEDNDQDVLFIVNEIRIYVNEKYVPLLMGCSLDYIKDKFSGLLTIDGTKVTNMCGCKKSFQLS